MSILRALIIAASLCADCFAVSLCSSVTLRTINRKQVAFICLSFAVIQTLLLFVGWAFCHPFVVLVSRVSAWLGFLLLLYVGGSMLVEGIRGGAEVMDLNGIRNILIGGVATSIDALGVGISMSMDSVSLEGFLPLPASVFVVTAVSVIAGIYGGKTFGRHTGRLAEITGGIVLIVIGVGFLI